MTEREIDLSDRADYERTRTELKTQLGQVDFETCWQAGRLLTVAETTSLVDKLCRPEPLSG